MMGRRGHGKFVRLSVVVLGFALTVSGGCSKDGYSGPTGTVTGKVTLDGKPVPQGCLVTFMSDAGFTASGKVGADGSYTLLNVDKPQIPAATYKVGVTQPSAEMSGADYDKYMSGGAKDEPKTAPATIPAKFQSSTTSELSFEVKEGPNTINIDLK